MTKTQINFAMIFRVTIPFKGLIMEEVDNTPSHSPFLDLEYASKKAFISAAIAHNVSIGKGC